MKPSEGDLLGNLTSLLLDVPDSLDVRHGATLLIDHMLCVGSPVQFRLTEEFGEAAGRAALAARQDRDDVDWHVLTHPGSVVWPVALTVAAGDHLSGRQLWRAAAVGYEGVARIARLMGVDHRTHFHPTSTAGTVGAALTATSILQATADQKANALGHSLSVMGGSIGCVRELTETRQFHRSHAVRTGIAAARAAQAGLRATRHDLQVGGGVLQPITDQDEAQLLDPTWVGIDSASVRVFPTSGWNQMAYEAARNAAASVRGRIRSITVQVPPSQISTADSHDSWVSVKHAVVLAIGRGQDHARLLASTSVEARPRPGACVEVVAELGHSSAKIVIPLGHPTRPVGDADIAAKWSRDEDAVARCINDVAESLLNSRTGSVSQVLAAVETLHKLN